MKRLLIIAFTVVVVLGASATALYVYMSPIMYGDITGAFSHDVADYVSSHDGKLPSDWNEFCEWKDSDGKQRWKADELNGRFLILLPAQIPGKKIPVYIQITDRKIKTMESFLNERIHYAEKNNG